MKKQWINCVAVLTILFSSAVLAEPVTSKPVTTQPAEPTRQELEKKLGVTLNHAVMNGSFTTNGSEKISRDKYTLGEVTKKDGDNWEIKANIKYGKFDVTLPLTIPIKWAGDTPVISVTNFGFPGLGQYTARVLFYGDDYVGIWSSADGSHGGKMWGKIEHPKEK